MKILIIVTRMNTINVVTTVDVKEFRHLATTLTKRRAQWIPVYVMSNKNVVQSKWSSKRKVSKVQRQFVVTWFYVISRSILPQGNRKLWLILRDENERNLFPWSRKKEHDVNRATDNLNYKKT